MFTIWRESWEIPDDVANYECVTKQKYNMKEGQKD